MTSSSPLLSSSIEGSGKENEEGGRGGGKGDGDGFWRIGGDAVRTAEGTPDENVEGADWIEVVVDPTWVSPTAFGRQRHMGDNNKARDEFKDRSVGGKGCADSLQQSQEGEFAAFAVQKKERKEINEAGRNRRSNRLPVHLVRGPWNRAGGQALGGKRRGRVDFRPFGAAAAAVAVTAAAVTATPVGYVHAIFTAVGFKRGQAGRVASASLLDESKNAIRLKGVIVGLN
jgi:hypothetical protein